MVDGYLLPKGSILFLNVWGVHHDSKRFPNPDVFDPDHFKGQTALAAEYANVADPDGRDHYGYGTSDSPLNYSQASSDKFIFSQLLTILRRQRPPPLSRHSSRRPKSLPRNLQDTMGV